MATKSILLTDKFQLVTNKNSYIQLKSIGSIEYYTTATQQADPLDAPPADPHAVIATRTGFSYPGGDYMYMRVIDTSAEEFRIAVDEVA